MFGKHQDYRPGEPLSARKLTRAQDALNTLGGITATPPLQVSRGAGGLVLSMTNVIYSRIGKPDADIAAASGATPGSGTVSVWSLGSAGDMIDTTQNITAYNLSGEAVTSGVYVVVAFIDGKWFIIYEVCS